MLRSSFLNQVVNQTKRNYRKDKRLCTKTETKSSKLDSVNEIEDISNNETEDVDATIHVDLNDLEINTDDFNF